MLTLSRRVALALLGLGLLLAAGWWIGQRLQLSGDLRKFMPRRDRPSLAKRFRAAAAAERTRMHSSRGFAGAGGSC